MEKSTGTRIKCTAVLKAFLITFLGAATTVGIAIPVNMVLRSYSC